MDDIEKTGWGWILIMDRSVWCSCLTGRSCLPYNSVSKLIRGSSYWLIVWLISKMLPSLSVLPHSFSSPFPHFLWDVNVLLRYPPFPACQIWKISSILSHWDQTNQPYWGTGSTYRVQLLEDPHLFGLFIMIVLFTFQIFFSSPVSPLQTHHAITPLCL